MANKTVEAEILKSTCDRVYLINAIVSPKRIECGVAVILPWCGETVVLRDGIDVVGAIAIPQQFQYKPTPISLSSVDDNVEFQLLT